jgi:hypothetical protein
VPADSAPAARARFGLVGSRAAAAAAGELRIPLRLRDPESGAEVELVLRLSLEAG